MAKRRRASDSFIAGFLVLLCIVAGVAIVIAISGGLETLNSRSYTVKFDLDKGVPSLERGSDVQIGGVRVGGVSNIRFNTDTSGNPDSILVAIQVNRRYTLRQDAVATLIQPLLGGKSTINFANPGSPDMPVAATDHKLDGELAGGLLAQAGIEPETIEGINEFLQALDQESGRDFKQIFANTNTITTNFATTSERLNTHWSPKIDSVLTNSDSLVKALTDDYPTYKTKFDEFLAAATNASNGTREQIEELAQKGRDLIDDVRELLRTNRPQIDSTINNIQCATEDAAAIAERFRNETHDLVHQTIENADNAVRTANSALDRVDTLIVEQTPQVRATVANLRLSADQLRDTLIEVRRSPWRLLYRPDQRETAYEMLYDTARSYAGAVSDLRAASEALDAITAAAERRGARPADRQLIEQLTTHLEQAFNDYADAERRFLELITNAGSE
ncbi:MAG: MlaD family protein [Phycisphaerales bacterium]